MGLLAARHGAKRRRSEQKDRLTHADHCAGPIWVDIIAGDRGPHGRSKLLNFKQTTGGQAGRQKAQPELGEFCPKTERYKTALLLPPQLCLCAKVLGFSSFPLCGENLEREREP